MTESAARSQSDLDQQPGESEADWRSRMTDVMQGLKSGDSHGYSSDDLGSAIHKHAAGHGTGGDGATSGSGDLDQRPGESEADWRSRMTDVMQGLKSGDSHGYSSDELQTAVQKHAAQHGAGDGATSANFNSADTSTESTDLAGGSASDSSQSTDTDFGTDWFGSTSDTDSGPNADSDSGTDWTGSTDTDWSGTTADSDTSTDWTGSASDTDSGTDWSGSAGGDSDVDQAG